MSDTVVIREQDATKIISVGIQGPPGPRGPKGDPGDPATSLVTSVAGRQGDVELDRGDVGLGNVENLSPEDLPVSTATQTALDGKVAGTGSIIISATEPVSPNVGDIWVDVG